MVPTQGYASRSRLGGHGAKFVGEGYKRRLDYRVETTKTDVAGESGAVWTFALDNQLNSLAAASSIKRILEHDATKGSKE